jgi:hypothetical protein
MLHRDVRKLKFEVAHWESLQISMQVLHREPPYLKNRSNAMGDFKNQKIVGIP